LGEARNVGLVSSTAPLITFLDDDDVRLPGSLDNQMKRLVGVPEAGMIYGKALYGDEQCAPAGSSYPQVCPEGDLFWELMIWNFIPCPTVLFRRACITRLGLLEQESPGIEDWDLWVRIAELYPVLAIDKPVAIWRQPGYSSEQFTARSEMLLRLAHRLHREKWLKLPRAIAAAPAQRRRTVRAFTKRASQQLLWEGVTSLKTKHLRKFTSVALASMRLHPIGISKAILSHAWSELQQ
jgi:hypothetical protein